MTDTYKVLGQSAPSATTLTDIYTCPTSTSAIVSTIVIANRSNAIISFRLAVSVGGGAINNKDYIYYDIDIQPYDAFATTIGITLQATDKIRMYCSTANSSISIFGKEIT